MRYFLSLILITSCGSDTSTSPTLDAGNDTREDLSAAGTCASYKGWVTDAVRALPRECSTVSDCMVVERAGNCECAISATIGGDLAAVNTALQSLDEHSCSHPFACIDGMSQCSYQTPFEDKELVVTCAANECGLIEVMACDTYVARKNGGLYPPGSCTVDSDCELRDDLNACGCDEPYLASFPFVLENEAFTLMQRNQGRCDFACDACPTVTEAFCDAGKCAAR
jgi:hypothetical protein